MALILINIDAFPAYLALSSDIDTSGSTAIGNNIIGKTIYATDTKKWYIVTAASGSKCTVVPFLMPKLEA